MNEQRAKEGSNFQRLSWASSHHRWFTFRPNAEPDGRFTAHLMNLSPIGLGPESHIEYGETFEQAAEQAVRWLANNGIDLPEPPPAWVERFTR